MIFTATVDEIVYLSVPTPCFAPEVQGLDRAAHRYKKMREFMVLDMAGNEGIPVTLMDVRALLSGRAPAGLSEKESAEVLAIAKANDQMLAALNNCEDFDLPLSELINWYLTPEVIDRGIVRGKGVTHGGGHVSLAMGAKYSAPDGEENDLEDAYRKILERAGEHRNPIEGAAYMFCALTLLQAFGDGNKRTSRLMASGLLLNEGIDAIYIPASVRDKYQEGLNRLFRGLDTSVIAGLLYDSVCSGDYFGDC
ncbi:MAG: Fic family protein [Varibaculum cambriense]|uniref:Fic family protein n=1 Tax=Varibaculum cambriense TaxID=184870 RepID=UPI00290CE2C6|nr:Fic family protein [Varibaculum cambriense]MDU6681713.1 Fic family protein [Varibaculum cambriense]